VEIKQLLATQKPEILSLLFVMRVRMEALYVWSMTVNGDAYLTIIQVIQVLKMTTKMTISFRPVTTVCLLFK
jgi:hypothetical protein